MLYNWLNKLPLKNIFLVVLILLLVMAFITNHTIINDNVFTQALGDQIPIEKIKLLIEIKNKYEWVSYIFVILITLLKYLLVAGIIQIGMLIYSFNVKFSKILKVVIIAEFIFFIPVLIKIIWFTYINYSYTLKDFSLFYPLSILNVLTVNDISPIWIYPLSIINVFDLTYIFLLAYGIKRLVNTSYDDSLKIIVASYVPGLLLWVVFIEFLTVMNSSV